MEIKEILESLGYECKDAENGYLRCRPIYRDSDNPTSLRVKKDSGFWADYGIGQSGSFGELIRMTLGLKSIKEAYKYLESDFKFKPNLLQSKPKIKLASKFSNNFVEELTKDHSYWIKRGISQNVIELFNGGIDKKKSRYWFPIFDSEDNIIGLTGRTLINSQVKWLHRGTKSLWNFPLKINLNQIQEKKEIILLESIGDCLACFEAGIQNCIVCFGIEVSNSLLSTLIKLDPKKIIISFNNDGNENANAGNNGAEKTLAKLSRYFDKHKIKIHLPTTNDLNDLLIQEGKIGIQKFYEF